MSELGPDSELLFDLRMPEDTDTYRAFRQPWVGRPADRPAVAADRSGDRLTAYASWNGATEVTRWELLAGASPDALRPVATAGRDGFETALEAETAAPWLAVRALDGNRVLGTSATVRSP